MDIILSIQSHVAFGYVGNKAASFPLQCLGYDPITVNTVQFSNHTGYGDWTGQIFSPSHIQDVINGLEKRGLFPKVKGVLSGYLGDSALGEIVLNTVRNIKKVNPDLYYCCDPVMGDVGRGFFVKDTIPDFFKNSALALSDIITPNQFEIEELSKTRIKSHDNAIHACKLLHRDGPDTILLTSLETDETPDGCIQMLVSSKTGDRYVITTPKIDFNVAPNGSGDLTAALFYGHFLHTQNIKLSLELTCTSVYKVLEATKNNNRRELSIVESRHSFHDDNTVFKAVSI